MKIKLFTIPNVITMLNLLCGCLALLEITLHGNLTNAFWLIVLAGVFDFLDGMTARLLGQYSAIGGELDSLSDMVSFGLVPAVAMFSLFNLSQRWIESPAWGAYGGYIAFIIACFSALRLAKFNIDTEQKCTFIGMPTPANALFCSSLCMLAEQGALSLSGEVVILISVIMSVLLVLPIEMLALKFKSLAWRENRLRYIFIALAIVTVIICRRYAVPAIIAIYIIISTLGSVLDKRCKKINE